MPDSFQLRIEGRGIAPETMALEDLLDLLSSFREAITAAAIDAGEESSDVFLSLNDIGPGSNVITLGESQAAKVGTLRIANAIASRDFSLIPAKSYDAVKYIWSKARKRQWTIGIENSVANATIDPSVDFPTQRFVRGRTALIATVYRVGGDDPPTAVLLLNGIKRTFRVASKAVAKVLAERLYSKVVLRGEAKWAQGSLRIADFRVQSVEPFIHDSDPVDAMKKLSEIAAGHWDAIDPEQYVREQRSDD